MTREETIKILKRDVGCRRLPTCPDGVNLDASCENCEYVTNYGDLTEAMEIAIKALEEPEIIRCKDCENWDTTWQNNWAPNYHYCPLADGTRNGDWYCADAERKGEEE